MSCLKELPPDVLPIVSMGSSSHGFIEKDSEIENAFGVTRYPFTFQFTKTTGGNLLMEPHSSLKVVTIVGTRPEIIKLSRVIDELDRCFNHVLVHTGQNYDHELNQIFFEELGIRAPDRYLNALGDTTAETIGHIIATADKVLEEEKPDAVLLYGDTNSTLSVISAKRRQIPIFHMEAGNRCFDQRVPEEINRRIVDHTADINLPLTEHARQYLIQEGIRPETIIKTGSTMYEVLEHHRENINNSDVLRRLNLKHKDYFLVSAHREENVDRAETLDTLARELDTLAQRLDKRVIFSVHPRTRDRIEASAEGGWTDRIEFCKPFGFFDYNHLQQHAFCVLSDSGTITEEASILGFPAVTLREAHERPEGMDQGVLVMSAINRGRIFDAVMIVTEQWARGMRPAVPEYTQANVSKQVSRIILSYTDYIKRTVWSKEA
ncbi:MAG: non-hydrolyzing UDP-N-acetylglucosamine 2-epimerase [Rubripirellula sp.]